MKSDTEESFVGSLSSWELRSSFSSFDETESVGMNATKIYAPIFFLGRNWVRGGRTFPQKCDAAWNCR
jgi:hypothetical protein